MFNLRLFEALLILLLLPAVDAAAQRAVEGSVAPDFTVTTVSGERITLSNLRGKIVVVNFWFVACPPCRQEIPGLNDLVAKFTADNVVFIAPALDRKSALAKLLAVERFDYRIVPAARGLATLYGVDGYPTHLVIGRDGMILKRMLGGGELAPAILRSAISRALADSTRAR